jgi:hypothetical protein
LIPIKGNLQEDFMKIVKLLVLLLALVLVFPACNGDPQPPPEGEDSLDMSIEGYPEGTDPADYDEPNQAIKNWVLWCEAEVIEGGAFSGGNAVKLTGDRSTAGGWLTIMKRVEPFIKAHGSGYYRWGCLAKVDTVAQQHFGNLGYCKESTGGWPDFGLTENPWGVTVGTSWTKIKTPDEGVWIDADQTQADGVGGGNGSKLVYMSMLDVDKAGLYAGEVYLCDFYFDFLGN